MGVTGHRHVPAALPPTPGKTWYPGTGGWVGPSAVLDGCGNSRRPPGIDPLTVQHVESRCIDCGIPAHGEGDEN